jgi:DNA-binding NarL/FixJ family response regulator
MDDRRIQIYVVSTNRIYREGLSHVLAGDPALLVSGMSGGCDQAMTVSGPAVVLVDISGREDTGLADLRRLATQEGLFVVALGLQERDDLIVACAEAGIAGYLTPDSSLHDLRESITAAVGGRFRCPPEVAAVLVRRLAATSRARLPSPPTGPPLTRREREIVRLIGQELSNKEIGRRLDIQLATVKNHVHNILDKLGVTSRADAVRVVRWEPLGRRPAPVAGRTGTSPDPS